MARVLGSLFGRSYEVANTTPIKCAMPAVVTELCRTPTGILLARASRREVRATPTHSFRDFSQINYPIFWGREKSVKFCKRN